MSLEIVYKGTAIFVSDMKNSRWFYEKVLGQKPQIDLEQYVSYANGVSIWRLDSAGEMVHGEPYSGALGSPNVELYFEVENIEAAWARVAELGAKVHQPLHSAPWGQRLFRLCDPDEYLVELAEPMPSVVTRLRKEGFSRDEVAAKTMFAPSLVDEILKSAGL